MKITNYGWSTRNGEDTVDAHPVLERNGLVVWQVFPEVPPRVEYGLTSLGLSLKRALDPVYT
jgi:hypothetical protein